MRKPGTNRSIVTESWRKIKCMRDKLGQNAKFEIFEAGYEIATNRLEVDVVIGEFKKENKISDSQLLDIINKKYNINEDVTLIYRHNIQTDQI